MTTESVSVFEIQRRAEQTKDANELRALRKLVPDSTGTNDQKQALYMFIDGGINNPNRPDLISKGLGYDA